VIAGAGLAGTHFRAMGVRVDCLVAEERPEASEAYDAVQREFCRLERIFSRFDPESELSLLNRLGRLEASPELADLADAALRARAESAGLVDVTVHDALVAWGYSRTYAEVVSALVDAPAVSPPCGGGFTVDLVRGVIELEPGTRLDFGGFAKGYAVDRACDLLVCAGACLVNAGGDLAVRSPAGETWPVGIETGGAPLTLNLSSGALATSGCDARRWRAGGVDAHHLIDPRTGAPSTSDLVRATAWGATAVEAEVRAKTLYLLGAHEAEAWARETGVPAVLVPAAGPAVLTGGLA